MKSETYKCDIQGCNFTNKVNIPSRKVTVMFDHDQEDGKSSVKPYQETLSLDLCDTHWDEYLSKLPYAYGAMGYNKYYMKRPSKTNDL